MNSRSVAGFPINRNANLQDGKIEVAVVAEKQKRLGLWGKVKAVLSVFRLFLFGYRAKNKALLRLEGSEFEVNVGEEVTWNFDGEKGYNGKLHVQVIPSRVNMLVPKKFK
jgi:diacylglycerol kinase family enzyme